MSTFYWRKKTSFVKWFDMKMFFKSRATCVMFLDEVVACSSGYNEIGLLVYMQIGEGSPGTWYDKIIPIWAKISIKPKWYFILSSFVKMIKSDTQVNKESSLYRPRYRQAAFYANNGRKTFIFYRFW